MKAGKISEMLNHHIEDGKKLMKKNMLSLHANAQTYEGRYRSPNFLSKSVRATYRFVDPNKEKLIC